MRILPAALTLTAAFAVAAPAGAAEFSEPRTLSDWGPAAEFLATAPGAALWTRPDGVRLWHDGHGVRRFPGEGLVQDLAVASDGGTPFAGWVDAESRLHAITDHATLVEGAMPRVRHLEATPSALAWIGTTRDDERKLQLAVRRPGGGISPARTPAQAGRPAFDVAAGGAGGRSLLAWPAQDAGVRRIQLLAVDAVDGAGEPRWVTGTGHDATSPAIAAGPGGAGVVAWVDGMPLGPVTAAPVAADGTVGAPQPLDDAPGGRPQLALGPGGAAAAVWPANGGLRVALRAPGAPVFAPAATLPAEDLWGAWTIGVTDRGATVAAWLEQKPGDPPRDGARLYVAVAPRGGGFGARARLTEHAFALSGEEGTLTWVEGRPDGPLLERRVRRAQLTREAAGDPGGGPNGVPPRGTADRRAPRVHVRVLGRQGRRLRIRVRADERATARVALRRGRRTVRRTSVNLRPDRARLLRLKLPAGARRITLMVRATDRAGNTRTVRRALRP
jgi:hypothetical protein